MLPELPAVLLPRRLWLLLPCALPPLSLQQKASFPDVSAAEHRVGCLMSTYEVFAFTFAHCMTGN